MRCFSDSFIGYSRRDTSGGRCVDARLAVSARRGNDEADQEAAGNVRHEPEGRVGAQQVVLQDDGRGAQVAGWRETREADPKGKTTFFVKFLEWI